MTSSPGVEQIMQWLSDVHDPEIPVLSLTDMGIIKKVETGDDRVRVTITPTFTGCPALDVMKQEIESALLSRGIPRVEVVVSYSEPWSSDMLTEKGKQALRSFGLAAPGSVRIFTDLDILEGVECPRCGGTDTELRSIFGSTLCRAMHFCRDCREAFEQFKPL